MQTEKAKSSHFDRTRGDKKKIFPTSISAQTRKEYDAPKLKISYNLTVLTVYTMVRTELNNDN